MRRKKKLEEKIKMKKCLDKALELLELPETLLTHTD